MMVGCYEVLETEHVGVNLGESSLATPQIQFHGRDIIHERVAPAVHSEVHSLHVPGTRRARLDPHRGDILGNVILDLAGRRLATVGTS